MAGGASGLAKRQFDEIDLNAYDSLVPPTGMFPPKPAEKIKEVRGTIKMSGYAFVSDDESD